MGADDLMDGFPPSPDRLVTLANWRKAPFSAWGFRNVRRLIPTADIVASGQAIALETSLEDIGQVSFTGHDGQPATLSQALPATVHAHNAMRAAGGVCVAPHDLARFGEMMRRRGVANGRQIVPDVWIDDINTRGDPQAWARSELAEMFPEASYRSQWYRIDRERGVLCAVGIHGQTIYIHPDAEIVIIRMASEATPLDFDRVRGWRRGFDAIAAHFL